MSETTSPAVLVERQGHILIATINRPEARNAVNAAVHVGLGEALEQAENDPEIRVVILTGTGDQAFCAGADLKALSRGERLTPEDKAQRAWGFAGVVQHPIGKPMIAAVNGFALGGGTELALACDLVVAADHAVFGLPEVKRGIYAAAGGAFRIAQQLPPKVAMEILLTGEPFSAQRALELGFANRVVPLDKLMETAIDLANRIAVNAPLSVQASKRIAMGISEGAIASDASFWEANNREGRVVMQSQDAKEGPLAFAQKRQPVWQAK
ncbi:MAG: crotonase/enoyl-CoA hydratase family protein [Sphingomonadales bacterium]|nr:crotonase/enoyl-CoA hydratase family protein [Sphingomonadales bacterium]MBK9269379.1 crotonase/enoyl-CoA hydratase family protein [Sphingomonadales bacterium]MBP6434405.1 crotonase/enoyl-CoA hydratase family protein [Sphingorhabdus sp.]